MRLVIVIITFVLIASVIGYALLIRKDTPDKVAERVARAWSEGNVEVILKYAPSGETARLPKDSFRNAYEKIVTQELSGLTLNSVERSIEAETAGSRRQHTFIAKYTTGKGVEFEAELVVSSNLERIVCGALSTLFSIYTMQALSEGGYDGSYPSFVKLHAPAQGRLAATLRQCGINEVYDPTDGRAIPISEFERE
jgi:hypothetical protein